MAHIFKKTLLRNDFEWMSALSNFALPKKDNN